MRKVLYQLNSLSEPMPGFFHCWAGTMQDAYALIEDTTTGKLHPVNCDQFHFVTPPEEVKYQYLERCHGEPGRKCNEGINPFGAICEVCNGVGFTKKHEQIFPSNRKVVIVGEDYLSKKCLDLLLPILESINKKLDTL